MEEFLKTLKSKQLLNAVVEQSTFPVYVMQMTGKKVKIDVNDQWTVQKLKTVFALYEGNFTYDTVKFIHQAKHMKNEKTLAEYKLTSGSVVTAAIRSTGGST